MGKTSIAARLFWLSAIGLVLALGATGLLMSELYSRGLERTLSESLDFQLTTLVLRVLEAGDTTPQSVAAPDPRFSRPNSGFYWQITSGDGTVLNLSQSAVGVVLPRLDRAFDATNTRSGNALDAGGIWLRIHERRIILPDIGTIDIAVTANWEELASEVAAFRQQSLTVLAVVGLLLASLSAALARVGLAPINRLRRAIENIRGGAAPEIEGEFPRELAPLAEEVNELLRSNAQIVERARNQVGNLAHGLKTPLAVLRNEARGQKSEIEKTVLAQTETMSGLVTAYLDRAQLSARSAIVGQKTDVGPVLTRLGNVMATLHRERNIALDVPDAGILWFRGDAGDLEEMAGNLIDNACKWARADVTVSARLAPGGEKLTIEIEDDGPGLDGAAADKATRRGVRLDEKAPGSGLGLGIVKELVAIYGGSLDLGRAGPGGLRATLTLPAARIMPR
ncbi:MAG: HAMP domain-containing sensor histidine kinase [Cucumibacter sp.]